MNPKSHRRLQGKIGIFPCYIMSDLDDEQGGHKKIRLLAEQLMSQLPHFSIYDRQRVVELDARDDVFKAIASRFLGSVACHQGGANHTTRGKCGYRRRAA